MSWAIIWTVLAILFAVIEGATLGLTTIWFAAGALVALFMTWIGFNVYVQVVSFIVSSILFLLITRPLVVKYMKVGSVKTNVDSLIGKKGVVVNEITEHNYGQVRLGGQVWTAKSISDATIAQGQEVIVEAIEGVKLVVSERTEWED
ncbi:MULTISPECIES: NfeD family protein [unclassified Fusibacter]|uniref:NfeD family protein n=1 Tax=unclassified Fusibacter TaxID=2624464 RepID=UPI00101225C1|nr:MULTISPECIES: NfeD family protein [unclassified Fusibacter]MCK8059286.1 NfeD family protein [Fusibacter sp. A2]NPE21250.1 NfeD family protein [Fusibacter sp. A1]RXV62515.1 NfeD family protein [Fusibacter sp. A1]